MSVTSHRRYFNIDLNKLVDKNGNVVKLCRYDLEHGLIKMRLSYIWVASETDDRENPFGVEVRIEDISYFHFENDNRTLCVQINEIYTYEDILKTPKEIILTPLAVVKNPFFHDTDNCINLLVYCNRGNEYVSPMLKSYRIGIKQYFFKYKKEDYECNSSVKSYMPQLSDEIIDAMLKAGLGLSAYSISPTYVQKRDSMASIMCSWFEISNITKELDDVTDTNELLHHFMIAKYIMREITPTNIEIKYTNAIVSFSTQRTRCSHYNVENEPLTNVINMINISDVTKDTISMYDIQHINRPLPIKIPFSSGLDILRAFIKTMLLREGEEYKVGSNYYYHNAVCIPTDTYNKKGGHLEDHRYHGECDPYKVANDLCDKYEKFIKCMYECAKENKI